MFIFLFIQISIVSWQINHNENAHTLYKFGLLTLIYVRQSTLHPIPLNFLMYEENFILFFISVHTLLLDGWRTGGLQRTYKYATGYKASCLVFVQEKLYNQGCHFPIFSRGTRNRRKFLLILPEFRLFHEREIVRNSVLKNSTEGKILIIPFRTISQKRKKLRTS